MMIESLANEITMFKTMHSHTKAVKGTDLVLKGCAYKYQIAWEYYITNLN